MPISLDVDIRGSTEEILEDALAPGIKVAVPIIARESLRAIQSPSSPWPVLTGFSKANFGTVIHGNTVTLVNVAEYAPDVEERTGAAEKAIRRDLDLKRIDDAIEKALDG